MSTIFLRIPALSRSTSASLGDIRTLSRFLRLALKASNISRRKRFASRREAEVAGDGIELSMAGGIRSVHTGIPVRQRQSTSRFGANVTSM